MTAHEWLTHTLTINTLDCILWPHATDNGGYPRVAINGHPQRAHVIACEHINGPKPDGDIEAAHLCHNRLCVNGRHLHWATPVTNAAERILNGTRQPLNPTPRPGTKLAHIDTIELAAQHLAGATQHQLATTYGVSQATISRYLHPPRVNEHPSIQ